MLILVGRSQTCFLARKTALRSHPIPNATGYLSSSNPARDALGMSQFVGLSRAQY